MHSLRLILSKHKYFSSVWVFASLNIIIGTWVLYIPYIKEKLSLDDGQLGIALFSFAMGILVFLPIVPFITKKIGVGNATLLGIILFALSFIFPLLTNNYPMLCLALFVGGMFSGMTDIAMNALVSEIEKSDSSSFMSVAHGFFSLGGVIGGTVGTVLISYLIDPFWHMVIIALFIIVSNLYLAKHYRLTVEKLIVKEHTKSKRTYFKPLISLAVIAFFIMICEGAVEHWSNLYLLEVIQIKTMSLAGLGFVIFSIMMTLGRFYGDYISERIGSVRTILYGCLIAIFGYGMILMNSFTLAILGFGILGSGLSVIIPELFRIAGKSEGISSSSSISFVSGIGFVGFLIGPVLLGLIADQLSLKISFILLLVLVMLAFLVSLVKFRRVDKK